MYYLPISPSENITIMNRLKPYLPAVILLALLTLVPAFAAAQQEEARVLRFPAIHGNTIAFSYAGNLYTVPSNGGVARRITSHEGYETFPRFSPDGAHIAFTGQYDGNTEVYRIPAMGGTPERLTYTPTLGRDDIGDRMGPNNVVMGWTPDGNHVLFRSRMREHNSFKGQLYLASLDAGLVEQLPLPRGGFSSYSPDGKKLAYNRIYREFRTWKRYRGGMADDISVYDFETRESVNITNSDSQDIIPMWHGNRIYFLSDRDENKRMNLFVYDFDSGETRQLTRFEEFDIKFPSIGRENIVFEYGGYIYRFNLATEEYRKLTVFVHDDALASRGGLIQVHEQVTTASPSPDANRVVFGARGEVFTVPVKSGITRNLTNTSGVHERNAKWSPDGKMIAWISDASGENEIWVTGQDGTTPARQITDGADTYYINLEWSPDSKKILFSDKMQRLRYVDVESGSVTEVMQADAWEIVSYDWSPDSRWIAYVKPEVESMAKIYLYNLAKNETHEVTDGWYSSSGPHFSRDGNYLFFTSNRDFNPTYSATEWNHAYQDMSRIYFVTLRKDVPSPFGYKNDEVSMDADENNDKDASPAGEVKIDTDGLPQRIVALPIQPSVYYNITHAGNRIYYMRNGSRDDRSQLQMYDLKEQKETALGQVNGYTITANGKKMLVTQNGNRGMIDLPTAPVTISDRIDLSGMRMELDRRAEWVQIFEESWRQMRDYHYAPNMHGVDWEAVRDTYRPLAESVRHRHDLTYVIGEMIGELNTGHAYVGGGDVPTPDRVQMGMLGAQLSRDENTRNYRIDRILQGQNWVSSRRSPLTEVGVDVSEGDYIMAVNDRPVSDMRNIYQSLIGLADKTVKLHVNSRPSMNGAREVLVKPIADEAQLYYYNWVQDNIRKVTEATDGRVGYIHIPDMGPAGLNEFIQHFYPQIRKEALIIDVRGNGGGNVSPMIIERLRRELAMVGKARNAAPTVNPAGTMIGPLVTLIDEFSASDGDIFPYRFRKHDLGLIIGKRSWGGVIGIRGSLPIVDGGSLNRPEFGLYDTEGKEWIIEGYGIDPDIEVENDPGREWAGEDQQLNRGIEEILKKLEENPVGLPEPPPYPVRN
jgi:tricorn protease